MIATEDDLKLIKKVHVNGGSIHLEGNVDHRPYMRLETLGWLNSRVLNLQEAVYTITDAGLTVALRD